MQSDSINSGTNNVPSLLRVLAFSAPSLPLAAFGLPIVIQLPSFYHAHVGLAVGVVGAAFMAARLFDVFIDLGLGLYMDKTNTKIGRFTPWLLAGAPLMSICAWFLFAPPKGAGPYYLVASLIGCYLAFSMTMLAQLGVGNSLSSDYDQRSRIFGFWQVGNIIGMLLVLALPVIIGAMGGTEADGIRAMGIFIMIMMPLSAIISWKFAKEDTHSQPVKHQTLSDLWAMLKLRSFRTLLASDIIMSFGMGVTGGSFMFYLSTIKHYSTQSSALLLVYFVIGLVCTPIWTFISTKYGKHWAFFTACLYTIFSQVFIYFMPAGNFLLALGVMAIAGIVYAAPILLLRSMVGDAADEDKLNTGKDRIGLLFAFMTLTSKAGYALSIGITYMILQALGFEARLQDANSQTAINGLLAVFFGFPIICNLIVGTLMAKYPLSKARVDEIQSILSKREANV